MKPLKLIVFILLYAVIMPFFVIPIFFIDLIIQVGKRR